MNFVPPINYHFQSNFYSLNHETINFISSKWYEHKRKKKERRVLLMSFTPIANSNLIIVLYFLHATSSDRNENLSNSKVVRKKKMKDIVT